nr:MAG TPA: hypothetical protein [Caudoviricetes sp.]
MAFGAKFQNFIKNISGGNPRLQSWEEPLSSFHFNRNNDVINVLK